MLPISFKFGCRLLQHLPSSTQNTEYSSKGTTPTSEPLQVLTTSQYRPERSNHLFLEIELDLRPIITTTKFHHRGLRKALLQHVPVITTLKHREKRNGSRTHGHYNRILHRAAIPAQQKAIPFSIKTDTTTTHQNSHPAESRLVLHTPAAIPTSPKRQRPRCSHSSHPNHRGSASVPWCPWRGGAGGCAETRSERSLD